MADSNDVLKAVEELKSWLYGTNGKDGDIPEIKRHLREANKTMLKNTIRGIKNESSIKWIIRILIAAGLVGGTTTGIVQWLG